MADARLPRLLMALKWSLSRLACLYVYCRCSPAALLLLTFSFQAAVTSSKLMVAGAIFSRLSPLLPATSASTSRNNCSSSWPDTGPMCWCGSSGLPMLPAIQLGRVCGWRGCRLRCEGARLSSSSSWASASGMLQSLSLSLRLPMC